MRELHSHIIKKFVVRDKSEKAVPRGTAFFLYSMRRQPLLFYFLVSRKSLPLNGGISMFSLPSARVNSVLPSGVVPLYS